MIADFQTILCKLYTDEKLRPVFAANPKKLFGEYNLTAKEKNALTSIPRDKLDIFAKSLSKKKLGLVKKTITINLKTLVSAGSLKLLWIVLKNDLFGKKITYL